MKPIKKLLLASVLLAPSLFASAAHATGTIAGKVEVTPAKYLSATVVHLKEVAGPYKAKTVTLDQKKMEFRPHVLVVTAGDSVKFLNSDGVDHNVNSPDGETYNLGMFPKGESRDHKFDKPGVYSQLCSVHPEMLGYVFVGQNPYAAVVDKKGHYTIKHVPPGKYQIAVWNGNSKLKAEEQAIEVETGKTAKADFSLAK